MKITLTGATSFLGGAMITELLRCGHNVAAVARPASPNLGRLGAFSGISIVQWDLGDPAQLARMIGKTDVFIHLAWGGVRGAGRQSEALQQANVENCLRAVDASALLEASCFIGAGSQAEYGSAQGRISEHTSPRPQSAYGRAKLLAGEQCQKRCQKLGMRFVWPRVFSLYGPGDYHKTLVMQCIQNIQTGKKMNLSACTQLWDYLYVKDAATAYRVLAETPHANGVYCLASGRSRPLREYVEIIQQKLGSAGELCFGAVPQGEDASSMDVDISRLVVDTGWQPEVTFEQGIEEILAACKKAK